MFLSAFSRSRLPLIRQTTISECGLACLAMVSGFHGKEMDLYTVRSRFAASLRGMNFLDIRNVAAKMDLAARGVRVDVEHLDKLMVPAILHWSDNHFVVLKKVAGDRYTVHDPAHGVVQLDRRRFEEKFSGIAMELIPTPQFERGKHSDKPSILSLFKGLKEIKRSLLYVFAISLSLELFVNLIPLYTQWVVDDVLTSSDHDLLLVLFLGYLFVIGFRSAISILRSWILVRFGVVINSFIQTRVFTHMMALPCSFFEQRHIGDVVSRYNSLNAVQAALTTNFVASLIDGVMCIFVGVIIFVYSKLLSAIAIAFVVLYGLIRWLRYLPLKTAVREQLETKAALDSHFLETIRGIRGVKLFNKQVVRREQWYGKLFDNYNKEVSISKLNIKFGELSSIISSVERGVIIFVGAKLVMSNQMTVGFLLAFIAYKDQFVGRIHGLIEHAIQLGMVRLEVERLWDIVGSKTEEQPLLPYIGDEEVNYEVELKNLCFRYSQYEPFILKNFNETIKPGEHVVITGRSGSGKSTLAKVISGVEVAEEGEVLIGGIATTTLGEHARSYVGTVMQDDELYSGTILENITFFDHQPDMQRVAQVAQVAEIHADIVEMKMGYNSIIGDMGSALSGGQKQRVLLARALYAQPKILILDEATSALDVELEKKIASNIEALEMTRISIAHRPQTIASADRIINI